jgi:hypothetical protein
MRCRNAASYERITDGLKTSSERLRMLPSFAPSSHCSAASRSVAVFAAVGVELLLSPFAILLIASWRQSRAARAVVKLRRTFVPTLPLFVTLFGSYAHALYDGVHLQRACLSVALGHPRACTGLTPAAITESPRCGSHGRCVV